MNYNPGDYVQRLEDRPITAATVAQVEDSPEGQVLLLTYEEGGQGWWPADAVAPAPAD